MVTQTFRYRLNLFAIAVAGVLIASVGVLTADIIGNVKCFQNRKPVPCPDAPPPPPPISQPQVDMEHGVKLPTDSDAAELTKDPPKHGLKQTSATEAGGINKGIDRSSHGIKRPDDSDRVEVSTDPLETLNRLYGVIRFEPFREWMFANVTFELKPRSGASTASKDLPQAAAGPNHLTLNDGFFRELERGDAKARRGRLLKRQDNLFAFELGKVLWRTNVVSGAGRSRVREAKFRQFLDHYVGILDDTHFVFDKKHRDDSMGDSVDNDSKFGFVCRIVLLDLPRTSKSKLTPGQWTDAHNELAAIITDFLKPSGPIEH